MEKASHEVTVNNQSEFNPSTIVRSLVTAHRCTNWNLDYGVEKKNFTQSVALKLNCSVFRNSNSCAVLAQLYVQKIYVDW